MIMLQYVFQLVHTTGLSPALLLNVPQTGIFFYFYKLSTNLWKKSLVRTHLKINAKFKPSNSYVHYSKLHMHYYYTGTIITRGACQWRGIHGVWFCVRNDQQSHRATF